MCHHKISFSVLQGLSFFITLIIIAEFFYFHFAHKQAFYDGKILWQFRDLAENQCFTDSTLNGVISEVYNKYCQRLLVAVRLLNYFLIISLVC